MFISEDDSVLSLALHHPSSSYILEVKICSGHWMVQLDTTGAFNQDFCHAAAFSPCGTALALAGEEI